MSVTSVAVTGVSGRVGQRLLRRLDADPDVDRVVGIDVVEPELRPGLLDFHALDVAAADLKPALEDVDVLVHLASVAVPLPDEDVMERVNVEGTRRLLDAAAATDVGKIVHVSSGLAYGAWPNNPTPITEDAPLRPNGSFSFAVHKAEGERLLGEWRDDHPSATAVVLRPAPVLGGGTPPAVRALVRGRLPFRVRDASPDVQFLHVDDLVSALVLAVRDPVLHGAYNVAPDGWLAHDTAVALARQVPRVAVSADVADRMLTRLWRSGVGDVPPGAVPLMSHPCVLAADRLAAAGWRAEHTNEEALLACVDETEEPAPRRGRRALAAGVGAGALAAAAGAAWAVLRRRR